jgi:hypothetical protein
VNRWSAAFDPVFVEGLAEVFAITLDAAPDGVDVQPDHSDFWRQFFRVQSVCLLLRSAESATRRCGSEPEWSPGTRIALLGAISEFMGAVAESGARLDVVYDSRSPANSLPDVVS